MRNTIFKGKPAWVFILWVGSVICLVLSFLLNVVLDNKWGDLFGIAGFLLLIVFVWLVIIKKAA